MSKELAHQGTSSVEMARLMADSTLLPRAYQKQPANLLFAFEYADALGIPRINALTSIHVIDGKPTASADLIAALVRRAGHKLRVHGDDTYAEATIIRADDPDYEPNPVRWDQAKAKKAGKWGAKGPWSQYPAAMLRSRAITEAARMWASDALYGVIYTPEELGAVVDEDGNPVTTEARTSPPQRVQSQRGASRDATAGGGESTPASSMDSLAAAANPEPAYLDLEQFLTQVNEATSVESLRALWPMVADLAPEHRDDVKAIIQGRVQAVESDEAGQPTLDAEIVGEDGAA